MDITPLLENTAPSGQLRSCHGLSFFVSCRGRRFLFDMGPNAMFAQNAQQLGIDLGQVDYATTTTAAASTSFCGAMRKPPSSFGPPPLPATRKMGAPSASAPA